MNRDQVIDPSDIKKVAVIGTGKMGSWIAKELANCAEVAVYDRIVEKAKSVPGAKLLTSLKEIESFSPHLLINAVSLQNTVEAFKEALRFLPPNCLLADIASVKGHLFQHYQSWQRRFVSSHPMFGPTFANLQKLADENAILIRESDESGKLFFRQFYQRFGLNIFEYSFEEHDKIIAYSLTVPFASTLVFAACLKTTIAPGTTFRKHLEIARSLLSEDDYLLAEILFNPLSLPQIETITQRLEFLKHIIRQRDYEEAISFFNRLRSNLKL